MPRRRRRVRWRDVAAQLKCTEDQLVRAILSPSPRGYVIGAVAEILLQDRLRKQGLESLRIVEKPAGGNREKKAGVRGDLYVRPRGSRKDRWWVVECKGLKSNAEKHMHRHGIGRDAAFKFLAARAFPAAGHETRRYKRIMRKYATAKAAFIAAHPGKRFPGVRQARWSAGSEVCDLSKIWSSRDTLRRYLDSLPDAMFEGEFIKGRGVFSILQTHKPNRRDDPVTGIKQAAPLKSDFSVLAVDLFLRTGRHEFVYAAANQLNTSPTAPNHLYQNYTIDILIPGRKRRPIVKHPWYTSFSECVRKNNPPRRKVVPSQLDRRTQDLSALFESADDA